MDLHEDTIGVCVLPHDGRSGEVTGKTYGTFRNELTRMRGWLKLLIALPHFGAQQFRRAFLHLETEKQGVDVVLVLASPDGKPLVTADCPNGTFGPEPASLIAGRAGEYQVRVVKSPRGPCR